MPNNQSRLKTWLHINLYGLALTECGTLVACLAHCSFTNSNYSMLGQAMSAASTGAATLTMGSFFAVAGFDRLYPTKDNSLTIPLTVTMDSLVPSVKKQRETMVKFIACVFAYSVASAPTGQSILKYLAHVNENLGVGKATAITALGSLALLVLLAFANGLYELCQATCCKKEEFGPRLSEASISNVVRNILSAPPSDDGSSVTSEGLNDTGEDDEELGKPPSFDSSDGTSTEADDEDTCLSLWCPRW
jgi:hypothetical protein